MDHADATVALARELIAIDSVNPGLVPGAAGEAGAVRHLRGRLEAGGWAVEVIGPADRPSLLATHPDAGRGPLVALNGHLDTVGVAGMAEPFAPRIDGDRLLGRGAADMKSGVAVLVTTAERLVAQGAPVRPLLALVADEEDASLGSEAVIAALAERRLVPDVCVITEPTDNALAASLRGFAVAEVTFTGRAAHSSQPAEGVNAIAHLGRFLCEVEERDRALSADGGSLMVTTAAGGQSPFVLAPSATCTLERRTVPGEDAEVITAEADQILSALAAIDPTVQGGHRLLMARAPWRLDPSGPAADLAALLGDRLGTGATFAAPYWMEAALWQALCPTLVCGPGGGGLHSADEWVDLRQVRALAGALPSAILAWAAGWAASGAPGHEAPDVRGTEGGES
ncbi:M20 family metallopeptidase [Actinomycetota bacterium]